MSAIEFSAQSGKTFSVQCYDAASGAAIGAAITGIVDSVTPTRYRADTGSRTGIVYVVATATNLRVAGYAHLDLPSDNGYSALVDTLSEASAAGGSDVATDIAEINAKISSGVVNVVSPVSADGSLNPIVIGDDYLISLGRQIDLYVDPIAGVDVSACTATFGGEAKHKGSWLVTGSVAPATIDGQSKWRMRFELTEDDTRDCLAGCYDWGATLQPPAGRATKITGTVELIISHTME